MRGSAWLLGGGAIGLWVLAVLYPLAASVGALLQPAPPADEGSRAGAMLAVTSAWALAAAAGAVVLGWIPGRVLGQALARRGYALLAAVYLVPICLPAYVVFYAWWQAWPPDSPVYAWAVEHQFVRGLRLLTLFAALVCWSWPIVAWCVAGTAAARPLERDEALRMDGATRGRCWLDRLRHDGPALVLGGLIVFLLAFDNTTCFDLADVATFGNELRKLAAEARSSREILAAGAPAVLVAAAGGAITWWLLGRRQPLSLRTARAPRGTLVLVAAIWVLSLAGPLGFFARALEPQHLPAFFRIYGGGFANTLALALVTALLGAALAIALAALWQDDRPWVRALAHVQALGWVLAALVPAPLLGAALETAWNLPLALGSAGESGQSAARALGMAGAQSDSTTVADVIYRRPAILVLGHLARFGFAAALLGRWLARAEPQALGEQRRLDGAQSLAGLVAATWPRLLGAAGATFALVLVFSLGEIALTAALAPPGFDAMAGSILNALHYQRPDVAVAALLSFLLAAALAALLVATIWAMLRSLGVRSALTMVLLGAALACGACVRQEQPGGAALPMVPIFGSSGHVDGRFSYPRAIAADAQRGWIYVVDKTARVQRFDLEGRFLSSWHMPQMETGKPTGLNVAGDGTVWVADTHYYRVIAFTAEGQEIMRFGAYGEEPGQFIYPTDVAIGPEDRLYVSEYGGNDRVQVFTAGGEHLFGFGSFGSEIGQFNRPQALAFDAARRELYVADSCNHRIVVVDPEGRTLRTFGTAGRDAGQLLYPYGLALLDDGTLLVAEFGNSRVQRLARDDGRSLGLYGRLGAAPGEIKAPWGVAVADERVFVLDSGNDRVQVMGIEGTKARGATSKPNPSLSSPSVSSVPGTVAQQGEKKGITTEAQRAQRATEGGSGSEGARAALAGTFRTHSYSSLCVSVSSVSLWCSSSDWATIPPSVFNPSGSSAVR